MSISAKQSLAGEISAKGKLQGNITIGKPVSVVELSEVEGGHKIIVTDPNGVQEITILDGKEGPQGKQGPKGQDGHTPVKGVDYFDGKDGKDGEDGHTPVKGIDYFDGKNGINGKDGYTPVKGMDYFDGKDGYTPVKGVDYFDGADGKDGKDGYTPIKGVDYYDGKDGKDGEDGYTPVKGVDYVDGIDGKDGIDGNDGKSAYLYARDGGYTGSEEEFAEKLANDMGGVASWNDLEDRPFYAEDETVILPESAMAYENDVIAGMGAYVLMSDIEFNTHESYIVTYNGATYKGTTVTAQLGDFQGTAFGNLAVIGGENTGEPFLMGHLPGVFILIPLDSPSTVSISIAKPSVVYKLDSKYLDLDWLVSAEKEILPLTEFTEQSNELPIVFNDLIKYKTAVIYCDGIRYTFPIIHEHYEGDADCGIYLMTANSYPDTKLVIRVSCCNSPTEVFFLESGTHTLSISVLDEQGDKKVNMHLLPMDKITERVLESIPKWNGGAY